MIKTLIFNVAFVMVSLPFYMSSQESEVVNMRKFFMNIPADLSDDATISQLKAKNYSEETKKQMNVSGAFMIRRYKLALFMMDNGYAKPTQVADLFSIPFSDGEPNGTIVSKNNYSQQELINYLKIFMDRGLILEWRTAVEFYNKPGKEQIFEFLKSKVSPKEKAEFDAGWLYLALFKDKVDINEVITLLKTTSAKVTPDIYTRVKLDNLEVMKLLFEKGADPNYTPADKSDTPIIAAMAFYVPEVVAFLLEKGADPCYKNSRGHDAIRRAKGSQKYCKDDKCKSDIDTVIDMIKAAQKKC